MTLKVCYLSLIASAFQVPIEVWYLTLSASEPKCAANVGMSYNFDCSDARRVRCQWASKMRILRDGNVQDEDTSTTHYNQDNAFMVQYAILPMTILSSLLWLLKISYPYLMCIFLMWDRMIAECRVWKKQKLIHQNYTKKFESRSA